MKLEAVMDQDSTTAMCDLEVLVAEAAELLPQQAPLHAFVHHNTLHHFEHLPFEAAVVEASKVWDTEGFQTEEAFARHIRSGRILDRDLEQVLRDGPDEAKRVLFEGGPSFAEFQLLRLRNLFEIPTGATLRWQLKEAGAASRLRFDVRPERRRRILSQGSEETQLADLWGAFERVTPVQVDAVVGSRWCDRLNATWGVSTDDRVHPLLIRLSAAFLDQGIAYWTMPDRECGFLVAVRRLYGLRLGSPLPWSKGLRSAFALQEREAWGAIETIEWALREAFVADADRAEVIQSTLLSLRGWAGMMRQFERYPHRAPVEAPPATLIDYLAVQLTLDLFAARAVVREWLGKQASLQDLLARPQSGPRRGPDDGPIYEAFVLAQLSDIPLERFQDSAVATGWLRAVRDFDSTARRQTLHLAYERRHRVEVLDALMHSPVPDSPPILDPKFQAVFCIDDREESIRRHLEEVQPAVETFGYAGFFGVAMDYLGLDDVRSRPLCPVVISPSHLVREVPVSSEIGGDYSNDRRRRAIARHARSIGARTLVRGGLMSSLLGPLSIIPLVGHALFPRTIHKLAHWLEGTGVERPLTRLAFEAEPEVDVSEALRQGYKVSEMADIVGAALRTMGLDASRSPLVVIVGHGSSSLNNPHEAAHDCGATGGGRGGPNARAFAGMANHIGVRALLDAQGLKIPDSTRFIGAYHNTCDESMTFYDEDLLPEDQRQNLAVAKQSLREACIREAHERCRRFETAPLMIDMDRGIEDVEEHAIDLAQPRPEYGHATNAICIVGRRAVTRNLFLDRRAFLVSYDPTRDPEGQLLAPLLLSVGPVGAGINLEYYFSFVDPIGYGSGTKLPHNITGLLGVMDGHASDLRTGLPWQMVEIHEPVRLLTIVDARPAVLERILEKHASLRGLIHNGWIQFVARDPESGALSVFEKGAFRTYSPDSFERKSATKSIAYYAGYREHLPPVWLDSPEVA